MTQVIEMSAQDVASALNAGSITLVDVREDHEYAAEHIAGAILMPLSRFDLAALPTDPEKPVVFHCHIGGRSARAVMYCAQQGLAIDSHLSGGIDAWKAAGLPTIRG
jgi:rhodanese-related sulfurtransferase